MKAQGARRAKPGDILGLRCGRGGGIRTHGPTRPEVTDRHVRPGQHPARGADHRRADARRRPPRRAPRRARRRSRYGRWLGRAADRAASRRLRPCRRLAQLLLDHQPQRQTRQIPQLGRGRCHPRRKRRARVVHALHGRTPHRPVGSDSDRRVGLPAGSGSRSLASLCLVGGVR